MARTCTVCTHPERDALDAAIVAGEPYRGVARRAAVSPDAVERHAARHLPAVLTKAEDAREAARAGSLLDTIRDLAADAHRIKAKAEEAEDLRTALDAIGKLTKIVELLAKLRGELESGTVVNVSVSAEWVTLRATILRALDPFPQARLALAEVLRGDR